MIISINKPILTLDCAMGIALKSRDTALKLGKNVSIAVVDSTGLLIYFLRLDNATNASIEVAILKAKHCAYYQRDTSFHANIIVNGCNLVLALPNVMPIEGGLQIIKKGVLLGAIGVAGVQSPEDECIASDGLKFIEELGPESIGVD